MKFLNQMKTMINKKTIIILLLFIGYACENKIPKATGNQLLQKKTSVHAFHSESIRDSIFYNVIEIKDKDVIENGTKYLFRRAIPKSEKTPVLFISARIPLEILSGIYPEFPKLIVIAPNWDYYDEAAKKITSNIGCAEPRTSTVIYEFNRETGMLLKDSIVVMDNFPEIRFKITSK
jgi:hypothetical protein